MTAPIESVHARDILDSRGNPTIAVTVSLDDGIRAWSELPKAKNVEDFAAMLSFNTSPI